MNGFILKNDIMNLPIAQKKKKKQKTCMEYILATEWALFNHK